MVSDDVDPSCYFDNLPEEILEFILSFLPPYKDLQNCMQVCKRWTICCNNVLRKAEYNLYKAIASMNINWKTITPLDMAPSITKRFSHAACIYEDSMYIFGGCTLSTAFNDLWRFDLSKRQWIRPLAMGTYPTPKAYATMIPYKDSLILFGGWAYTVGRLPISHDWMMSSETHFYNTSSNRWFLAMTINNPPSMAGHSAIIKGNTMVVFGGRYKPSNLLTQSSNDIWILDLNTLVWTKQSTNESKPPPRYGQSLIKLDEDRVMILGGIRASRVFHDCWILSMKGCTWTWFEVPVKCKEWSVEDIYLNPACKVGDKVVLLSHRRNGTMGPIYSISTKMLSNDLTNENTVTQMFQQNMQRKIDKDSNVNGQRGILPHHNMNDLADKNKNINNVNNQVKFNEPKAGPSGINLVVGKPLFTALDKSIDDKNIGRQKLNQNLVSNECKPNENISGQPNQQLMRKNKGFIGRKISPCGGKIIRHIRDTNHFKMAAFSTDLPTRNVPHESGLFNHVRNRNANERQQEVVAAASLPQLQIVKPRKPSLDLHVLDIANVLNNDYSSVSWVEPQNKEIRSAPDEIFMYTLLQGTGELIMFGGLHSISQSQSSNSVHFIIPPRNII